MKARAYHNYCVHTPRRPAPAIVNNWALKTILLFAPRKSYSPAQGMTVCLANSLPTLL